MKNFIKKLVSDFVFNNDLRDYENNKIIDRIKQKEKSIKILDAGCGSGLLLNDLSKYGFENLYGLDLNSVNVENASKNHHLKIKLGNVLNTGYEDNFFDVVICSHVLQIFDADKGFNLFKELGRILNPGGLLVIVTLNDFKRFFKHPENCRPYPPDAILRLINTHTSKVSAPIKDIDKDFPNLKFEKIWKRLNPLIHIESRTNTKINKLGMVINTLQYKFNLVNPLSFNAFIIFLEKKKI